MSSARPRRPQHAGRARHRHRAGRLGGGRTGGITLTLSPATGGAARVFDDPAFAVILLADALDFHLGLAWRPEKADDPVVTAVLDAVRDRWADGELVL